MGNPENSTKKLIIEKAVTLFKEKGFDNVTINDICSESGVNKNTFYYYFLSKDEILKGYNKFFLTPDLKSFSEILGAEKSIEMLWMIFSSRIENILSIDSEILKRILAQNIIKDGETFQVSKELKEIFRACTGLIKKAQENGEILNMSSPKVLAILLEQNLHFCIFHKCMKKRDVSSKTLRYFFETVLNVSPENKEVKDDEPINEFFKEWNNI